MLASVRWLAVGLVITAGAACGGRVVVDTPGAAGGGAGGSGLPPPSIEAACAAYWDASCTQDAKCYAVSTAEAFGDQASCKARMTPACVNGLSAAGAQPDTAALSACAAAIAGLSCEEYAKVLAGETDLGVCAREPGLLPLGAACGDSGQCASTVCNVPQDSTCGVCVVGDLGAACNGYHDCQVGLQCNEGKCSALGQLGDLCDNYAPCSVTLACIQGTCGPLLPEGAACPPMTIQSPCEPGLLCLGFCQAYDAVGLGSPCGLVDGAYHTCLVGGYCKNNFPMKDVCQASVADNMPCTPGQPGYPDPCRYPAVCDQGICRYPDPSTCQ